MNLIYSLLALQAVEMLKRIGEQDKLVKVLFLFLFGSLEMAACFTPCDSSEIEDASQAALDSIPPEANSEGLADSQELCNRCVIPACA